MKKVVAAAAAFLAAVAPCSMFFASIEPVRAFATEITLTDVQTRALFGDVIQCSYMSATQNQMLDGAFEYLCGGSIGGNWDNPDSNWNFAANFNAADYDCIIYKFDNNDTIYTSENVNGGVNLWIKPSIDLSNLNYIKFGLGLCDESTNYPEFGDMSNSNTSNRFKLLKEVNDSYTVENFGVARWYNWRQKYYTMVNYQCHFDDVTSPFYYTTNLYQVLIESTDLFSIATVSEDSTYSDQIGLFLREWVTDVNGEYYLCILCPVLSDGYINNNSGSSSESGSDSGIDYSGDLQDILAKLDEIAQNQRLHGQVVNEQLNDIYIENQRQNSKLDSANDKLNQVNSNLNKIDSHIQALQIPDLTSQSSGDMSHVAQNESRNDADLRTADANQQVINSVAAYGDVSLPSLENVHSMPDDFSELWNYTDQDGLSWVNPLLYAMPILTLTVGALAYIVFGRAR